MIENVFYENISAMFSREHLEAFEELYPEELRMTGKEKQAFFGDHPSAIGYWLISPSRRPVAEMFGAAVADVDGEDEEDSDFQKDLKSVDRYTTFYIYSTTVLPEFQNEGMATRMRLKFLKFLAIRGYQRVCGHATTPAMMRIAEKFGAVRVGLPHPNWYGSQRTAQFYVGPTTPKENGDTITNERTNDAKHHRTSL
jgi:hypothetical protein